MRKIGRALVSRWSLSCAGAVLLAFLVWLLGQVLRGRELVVDGLMLVILLVWLLANLLLDVVRRRADRRLAEGIAAASPSAAAQADEAASLREKLATAMRLLRKASGTRGYLYEQPWYVIIGPPGAGKTTALLNAGLKFPLAAEMGQGAVAGIGGTRQCDWWFTEQAVLIDTAGRYTTQDSDSAVDRAGWEGFLDLLRRTRPKQPLNGVLVAIGVTDIALAAPSERSAHAAAIRRRIKELTERLGLRLPIYALFTKADLLAGFSEFFDDLDRVARDQVWGHSFALAEGSLAGPATAWGEALRGLVGRLNGRLLDRLAAERSVQRRALLAGFPAQLASLEVPLGEFLTEAFAGSRLDPAPQLRGFYLTSGTQAGTPIDRLTGVLAQSFGLDQMRVPSLRPQQGRSYFLGGLLRLIFNEAMLASTRPGAMRRRLLLRIAGFAVIALLTLTLAAGLGLSWRTQQREAQRVAGVLSQYSSLVQARSLDPVASADLRPIMPLLDQAGRLAHLEDHGGSLLSLGLSQNDKYAQAARFLYQRALQDILLPRLVLGAEQNLRSMLTSSSPPEQLYEATRVYQALCSPSKKNAGLIRKWAAATAEQFPSLPDHLDALLSMRPLPRVAPDTDLVAAAMRRVPNAEALRLYRQIAGSAEAKAVPGWTPATSLGASGDQIFVNASGKLLPEGVAGLFTPAGFSAAFLPQWLEAVAQAPEDHALGGEILKLYTDEYERTWDAALRDLTIRPLAKGAAGVWALDHLARPGSPLQTLLSSIVEQLTPDRLKGGVVGLAAKPGEEPGKAIADYYAPLRDWVGPGSGAQLDFTLKLLGDLRAQLSATAAETGDAAQELKVQASHAPLPVAEWLQVIATGSADAQAANVQTDVKAAFQGAGGPGALCRSAVAGNYPFKRDAVRAISMRDFTRLFAPGGGFGNFFTSHIARFIVDPQAPSWRLQSANGVPPPINADDLAQFQRAQLIGQIFFADSPVFPSVHFSIAPEFLDARSKQATLDLGGTSIPYLHQPVTPMQMDWPSSSGMASTRLSFDAQGGTFETDGPWALFRLIDRGTLHHGTASGSLVLSFQQGSHRVEYQLRADPALSPNPFTPGLLEAFRCPLPK